VGLKIDISHNYLKIVANDQGHVRTILENFEKKFFSENLFFGFLRKIFIQCSDFCGWCKNDMW